MITIKIKKILDHFQNIKTKLKKNSFYYLIRDYLFKREMKREKKIETKYGKDGIVDYVKKWYKNQTGIDLNLQNPKRLTEKQQWIKLYDQSDLKVLCTDKYKVREYISSKIGSHYLVPIIKINGKERYYSAEEIPFDLLPNQFVLSCNHGSSMTIVVEDKNKLTKSKIKSIKSKLDRWLKIEPAYIGAFDFTYKGIKPCIIITEFLSNNDGTEINDYKFISFNGVVKYMWIDSDRFNGHKRSVFNLDLSRADFNINKYQPVDDKALPKNYLEMLELAKCLAKDFLFVRVDFYNVDGKIYFGELTFNSGGGVELPYPDSFDKLLGDQLDIG